MPNKQSVSAIDKRQAMAELVIILLGVTFSELFYLVSKLGWF